jgi:hypothetical protein
MATPHSYCIDISRRFHLTGQPSGSSKVAKRTSLSDPRPVSAKTNTNIATSHIPVFRAPVHVAKPVVAAAAPVQPRTVRSQRVDVMCGCVCIETALKFSLFGALHRHRCPHVSHVDLKTRISWMHFLLGGNLPCVRFWQPRPAMPNRSTTLKPLHASTTSAAATTTTTSTRTPTASFVAPVSTITASAASAGFKKPAPVATGGFKAKENHMGANTATQRGMCF